MNSLKSIYSRLTSVQPAIDAMGEIGVNIHEMSGELRPVSAILDELGGKWSALSAEQQQNLGLQIAGRFQLSRFLILMDQYQEALDASATAENSAGSGYRENAEYLKSFEAQINSVKNAWTEAIVALRDGGMGDSMIIGLNIGLKFMEMLTAVIDKIGLLPAVLGTAAVAFTIFSTKSTMAYTATNNFAIGTLSKIPVIGSAVVGSLSTMSIGMQRFASGTGIAAASVGALRTVMATAFPIAAVMALGSAIGWVTGKISDHIQEQKMLNKELEEFKEKNLDAVSTNQEQVNALIDSYEKLSVAKDSGEWNNEKEQEYLSVQEELATLFPALIDFVDEKGNKHVIASDKIKEEIEAVKKLYDAEQMLKLANSKDEYKEKIKQIDEYTKKVQAAENLINSSEAARSRKGMSSDAIKQENLAAASDIRVYEAAGSQLARALSNKFIQDLQIEISSLGTKLSPTMQKALNDSLMGVRLDGLDETQLVAFRSALAGIGQEMEKALASGNEAAFNKLSENFQSVMISMGATESEAKKLVPTFNNLQTHQENLNKAMDESENIIDGEVEGFEELANAADIARQAILDAFAYKIDTDVDSSSYEDLAVVIGRVSENKLEAIQSTIDYAAAEGLSAEETVRLVEIIDAEIESIGVLTDKRYDLVSVTEILSGVSQNLINDTDDLLYVYDQLSARTAGQTEEDVRLTAAKQQLLDLYPHLFSAGTTALNMTDEQINAVRAEVKANDVLIAAYAASRDGKLTAEQESTVSALANTNERINIINAEIAANNKLIEAYSGVYDQVKQAAEAGNESAAKLLMRISVPVGRGQMLQAELAQATAKRTSQTNILSKALEVANRTTTRGNQGIRDAAKATEKANKAKAKNAKASKNQTKAQKEATKAMEHSIFVANKYKLALEAIELEIKKQQNLQANNPVYSDTHIKSIQREIQLQKEKKDLLAKQNVELQKQIKAGKILETGVVTKTTKSTTSQMVKASGFNGRVTSGWGTRIDPKTKQKAHHTGVDISQPIGTRLDAPISGTVIKNAKSGQYGTYGNVIMIQEASGIKHLFAHLDKSFVKLGQQITAGQQIGTTGNTGRTTGPHLHYEVRNSANKELNPIPYLNAIKKGIATTTTKNTTSKEAAQNLYDVENAQSEFIKRQEEILAQDQVIAQLEASIIDSKLAQFDRRRQKYDQIIDNAAERFKSVDPFSAKATEAMERQTQFMEHKQIVNQEELKYLNDLIKKGNLSAIAIDAMKDRAIQLQTEMIALGTAIKDSKLETIGLKLGSFDRRRQNYDQKIDLSAENINTLDPTSDRYLATLERQKEFMEYKQQVNQEELKYLNETLKKGGLSAKATQELKDRTAELNKEIISTGLAIRDLGIDEFHFNKTDKAIERTSEKISFLEFQLSLLDEKDIDIKINLMALNGDQVKQSINDLDKAILETTEKKEEAEARGEATEKYDDRLKTLLDQRRDRISQLQSIYRDTLSDTFNKQLKEIEKSLFDGKTETEARDDLEKKYKLQDAYLDGLEKEIEVESIINFARKNNLQLAADEIKLLTSRDKIEKKSLERLQKVLEIRELEQRLANLSMEKNIQQLKKDENGNWNYEYVVDQDAIDQTQKELSDKKLDLIKFDQEKEREKEREELEAKSEFYAKYKELVDKALSGEIKDFDEFATELDRLNAEFLGGMELDSKVKWESLAKDMALNVKNMKDTFSTYVDDMKILVAQALVELEKLRQAKAEADALQRSIATSEKEASSSKEKTSSTNTKTTSANVAKFDTGGLTGSWGSSGKLAMLHEKELILNKDDTKNMLSMVNLTRGFIGNDSLGKLNNKIGETASQVFHIAASFPNVKNQSDIENAFLNMPAYATVRVKQ